MIRSLLIRGRIQRLCSPHNVLLTLSVLTGLAYNLFFATIQRNSISIYNLGIDTAIYRSFALNLANTGALEVPHAFAPGIVFYLATVFFAFGYSPFIVKIIHCFLIAIISLLGAWLGKHLYNARTGLFCAMLLSYSPLLRSYGMTYQYEVLVTFLFTASLTLFLWSHVQKDAVRKIALVASGFILGLSALTREIFLTAFPFFLLALFRMTAYTARWRSAVIFSFAFLVPVLWWIGRIYLQTGELVPISMKGPFNLMAGNNPLANGTFNLNELPMVNGDFQIPSPHGVAFWLQEPRASIELIVRKFLLFWGFLKDGWDVPHPMSMVLYHLSFHQIPLQLLLSS
jgi:4-amino-4-deoxy-L-arabinose transferase-like glycosyltransferase